MAARKKKAKSRPRRNATGPHLSPVPKPKAPKWGKGLLELVATRVEHANQLAQFEKAVVHDREQRRALVNQAQGAIDGYIKALGIDPAEAQAFLESRVQKPAEKVIEEAAAEKKD